MSQSAPTLPEAPSRPSLSPQFCFNQTALRDFLRLSRSTVDDTISQNLNALLTPSVHPFNPNSSFPSRTSTHRTPIPAPACTAFKSQILFPVWQSRSDVLAYCAAVATSPDPEDPDLVLREVEDARARERVVDERLDPYSGRYFPREARTEALAALIRNERMIEGIVRSRTWGMVMERCAGGETDHEKALETWRRESGYKSNSS